MEDTIEALGAAGFADVRVMIGGGQIDEETQAYTQADGWGRDAMTTLHLTREWYGVAEG
jgi:methanogenic corrinoid protein MtbC1